MMEKIRAIVFDWDQTLWDSWELHVRAIQHAAGGLGLPKPSRRSVLESFGGTLEEHLLRLYGNSDGALNHYLEFYRTNLPRLGRLFPGVADTLKGLQRVGVPLAVLSDKVVEAGRAELVMVGLEGLFHTSVFRDGTNPPKPHPQGLLEALKSLGVAPAEALYVGDAPWDVECARRAGVRSAGALWGCVDPPALLAAGPDLRWRQPAEALRLLAPSRSRGTEHFTGPKGGP